MWIRRYKPSGQITNQYLIPKRVSFTTRPVGKYKIEEKEEEEKNRKNFDSRQTGLD